MSKDLFGADISAVQSDLMEDFLAAAANNDATQNGLHDDNSTMLKTMGGGNKQFLVGELYFDVKRLKGLLKEGRRPTTQKNKDMSDYEKLRVVGKGQYQKSFQK
jgi:hypothetical protein